MAGEIQPWDWPWGIRPSKPKSTQMQMQTHLYEQVGWRIMLTENRSPTVSWTKWSFECKEHHWEVIKYAMLVPEGSISFHISRTIFKTDKS